MDRGEGETGDSSIGDSHNLNTNGIRYSAPGATFTTPCVSPQSVYPPDIPSSSSCLCCSSTKNSADKPGNVGIEMADPVDISWKGKRKYEYFQGNNQFYCGGRIMTAPSIKYFSLSFALILITFGLFVVFDAPFLTQKLSIAIPIVSAILFVLVVSNMLRTSCSDPGIIPRASASEVEHMERSYGNSAATYRPPPRTKDIVVNGQVIKSKYCFTCRMFRPPRASHCSVCDNCVERFDHHCPFLGNCVGRRNYRSFYFFVVSLSLLAIYILSFSIVHLAMLAKEYGDFLEALRDTPTSAVVIIISFFGMWTVIGLAGFHTYLIAVEQTTNEDIKGLFGRPNSKNPYSRGSTCGNCCYILCGPFSTSLLDPRGYATQDFFESIQKPKHVQMAVPPNAGVQVQQLARAPLQDLAAAYGLPQYACPQGSARTAMDISQVSSTREDTIPSRQIMALPVANPPLRTNGIGVLPNDQSKAGTFPESLTDVTGLGTEQSNDRDRQRLNGHLQSLKISSIPASEAMSMVHLQPRLKSRELKEGPIESTVLRSSASAASLERWTMINSPLHLDPVM